MERIIPLPDGELMACLTFGQGRPIVCIHAPCIGSVNFQYQQTLADTYELIIPDLPGHGRSSALAKPYTIHDLATRLHRLLGALGLERPYLLGYSQGASIALEYALCFPEEISGLILASGFSEVDDLYLHSRFSVAQALATLHGVPLLARSIASSHTDDPQTRDHWIQHASRTDAGTLKQLYAAGHSYRCTQRLHELSMPTLLVYGGEDTRMHPYGQLFRRHLPHAKLIFLPGVPHQVVTKAAASFNQLCRDFVAHEKKRETIPSFT